jgi:hypothetical protein
LANTFNVAAAQIATPSDMTMLTMHHDISTVTDEGVILFTFAESPMVRDAKKPQFHVAALS